MKEVTDPELLASLNAAPPQPAEVTDPSVLLELDHGFSPATFGTDFNAARSAIDALPKEVRQDAIKAYARHFVTKEREGGGILQTINDHVRMAGRNVPYLGEFLDEANALTASALGGDYELAHAAEQERRSQIDATERSGIETPVGTIDTGDVAKGAGLVGGAVAAPFAAPVGGTSLAAGGVNAGLNAGLMSAADAAGAKNDGTLAERGEAAGNAAMWGVPTGVVGGMVGQKILNAANKAKPTYGAGQTTDDLRQAADAGYKAVDDSGVIFSKAVTERVAKGITDDATEFGYHPGLQPKIKALISEADRLTNDNVTIKGMDTFRKMVGNVLRDGDQSEKALAGKIMERIDDAIMKPKAGDVITGDGAGASKALVAARDNWRTMRKSEAVENAIATAQQRAATAGSGGNIENSIRQELRKLITNKKSARMFSEAERADLEKLIAGSRGQNLLRRIGKLSPEGNGLMLMGHLFGGMATGGGTLGVGLAGFAAKRFAERGITRNAEAFQQKISGGGQIGEHFARWQKIVQGTATAKTKKVATAALAAAIAKEEGGDKAQIEATLGEIEAEGGNE